MDSNEYSSLAVHRSLLCALTSADRSILSVIGCSCVYRRPLHAIVFHRRRYPWPPHHLPIQVTRPSPLTRHHLPVHGHAPGHLPGSCPCTWPPQLTRVLASSPLLPVRWSPHHWSCSVSSPAFPIILYLFFYLRATALRVERCHDRCLASLAQR